MTDLRIYAACLASYNAGILHGTWIDCDGKDADELRDEVAEMLRASPCPNVTVEHPETGEMVPSAEEFAIHDHEGFGRMVGEWTSLDDVAAIAEGLERNAVGFRWLVEDRGYTDLAEAARRAEEVAWTACGVETAAAEFYEEVYSAELDAVPSVLRYAIDWEQVARGLTLGGDFDTFDDPDEGTVTITNASAF